MEVAKCVGSALPSPELAQFLVSQLCLPNNHQDPSLWKFLHRALSSTLLSPFHVLALLTSRVIPHRWSQPEAYRLYLEILSRYAFSFDGLGTNSCREKIIISVDSTLQLSQTYGVQVLELGHALVLSFFSILIQLIDSTLGDWGLQMTSVDKASEVLRSDDSQNMDVDSKEIQIYKRNDHRDRLRKSNSFLAFEVLGKLMENRKAMVLLRLVYLNMPEKFNGLLQRMQFLEAHTLASPNLKSTHQLVVKLSASIRGAMDFEYHLNKRQFIGMLIYIRSYKPALCCNSESGRFAFWVPFDINMEDAMDGKQFPVTSAIDILTETINTLKVFNRASWQETFLALWLSALRLVQRERDPLEGPVPHLEARLCVLLSITPLAIARVLEDNATFCSFPGCTASRDMECGCGHGNDDNDHASRKQGLISSLQVLGHFTSLLCPPASVVNAANIAAAKATSFMFNSKNVKDGITGGGCRYALVKAGGDMRHLIVEACIARKLIDTSAYFWPGYVSALLTSVSEPSPLQKSPWSTFMEGAPLTSPLINALMTTPASSYAEVEKLYYLALNGSEEEKSAAAKILCSASLSRGWNLQEHVVHFVVKLLSPPIPPNFKGSRSHLVEYMSMLSAILFEASSIDTVHILSLHGVVPEVAASLLPLCESFGSLVPTSGHKLSIGDESSIYMVFSSAFLFLLRLWKFYRPPLEQCVTGRGGALRGELTLEYLLLLRNSRIRPHNSGAHDEMDSSSNTHGSAMNEPIYIDSYPKLRAWYCQNKSCIASTLSGLCSGNPVHEVANKILNMICWKMTTSGTMSSDSSMLSSSSVRGPLASTGEDAYQRPVIPAWEVLEAIPYVLEAILTACAHGRISSRDLTIGLRELVDFLPASLAAIISYFSAEITRGTWKPVSMNGIDWPSPAANLTSVESEMKEILAAAGVNVPSFLTGVSPAMLPLPMAALVSLTITFKLDKRLEYIHAVAGPALENCALGCSWPSMPIIGSLWAQKVRRWHDFIVVSCSRSVFRQNQEAVAQLMRSCFASFLGSPHVSASPMTSQNGVNGLLGSFISAPGLQPRVAPGFLYLRSCRTMHHVQHVNHVIVELVANSSRELAARWVSTDSPRLKSTQASLAVAIARAKEVATLGASLLCVAGGLQLVQELYQETIPTWLLSAREEKNGNQANAVSRILEGYSMAYLLVLSGALVWGVSAKPPSLGSRRLQGIGIHMDFVVGVLEGNISVGCDPGTWKAYVSCLVGLVVSFAPVWIREVKQETLRKLANGLRGWHECELALFLLERGGVAAMGSAAELVNVI
ncbi:mediator of RNA polymerase II transcription subunit 33A-like [Actinidia eriantha]|uniref:mediator of RNA polymerase II transcription subunit 33A-like n=1 Tax=Actinidia eriantha TaxID=165200 RepID=UPI0025886451|nr:mediator of RNA polymerase II transcription subunit 33A-like [Actinidia eriantha]